MLTRAFLLIGALVASGCGANTINHGAPGGTGGTGGGGTGGTNNNNSTSPAAGS